jgi:hypothetical protein
MVLIDGSPFRWLGHADSTLVGAMDDATGRILALTFRPHEDLHGFTVILRDTVQRCGVPWTLYGDRAGALVRNDRHWTLEEELQGRQDPSHFGRMLEALGVRYIAGACPDFCVRPIPVTKAAFPQSEWRTDSGLGSRTEADGSTSSRRFGSPSTPA